MKPMTETRLGSMDIKEKYRRRTYIDTLGRKEIIG
jgi:hypothetical protein